jgi:hypothetical protein
MSKFTKTSQQAQPKPDTSNDQQILATMKSYAPKMTAESFMKGMYDISQMPAKTPQEIQAQQNAFNRFVQAANSDLSNFANYLTKLGIKF